MARKSVADFEDGIEEDSDGSSIEKIMRKQKGKISKEEAQVKLHQIQMESLDGEIQSMI